MGEQEIQDLIRKICLVFKLSDDPSTTVVVTTEDGTVFVFTRAGKGKIKIERLEAT